MAVRKGGRTREDRRTDRGSNTDRNRDRDRDRGSIRDRDRGLRRREREDVEDDTGGPTATGRGVVRKAVGESGNWQQRFERLEEVSAGYVDELARLRRKNRELNDTLDEYESDGVLVLDGDDAKEYESLSEILKTAGLAKADDVKKRLELIPGLQEQVATTTRRTDGGKAAELLGWKNAEAVVGLITDKKLNVTFVDGQDQQGKAIKIPHVKPEGSDDKVQPVALSKWVDDNAAYLKSALTVAPPASGATGTNTGAHGGPARNGGTQMVDQSSGATGGTAPTGGANAGKAAVPGVPGYKSPTQYAEAQTKK
jgi:hypothetical protein